MSYQPPLALTIISSISIGIAGLAAAWILTDIIVRRGWRTMMAIMIPVYVVNALYLWPITLWTYLSYGRPSKPPQKSKSDHEDGADKHVGHHDHKEVGHEGCHAHRHRSEQPTSPQEDGANKHMEHHGNNEAGHGGCHSHGHGSDRPMFATVTIAVCHCGAGCVLGDIVGEWLVYGVNASFGNPPRLLWAEYLVGTSIVPSILALLTDPDSAFAFLFGIIFQYFSIVPMTGEYGPKVLVRALKADILSLLFFQIGLFGWMAAYQIGIFNWQLEVNTVTYWWMMQVGMFIGHWTGVPINYLLIKKGIKEPCA